MRKSLCLLFLFLNAAVYGQKETRATRPKLVVGIVVDQMRWDYIYRFQDRYSANGFKRMLKEGFSCENTYIDYLPTVTAIGHTTVYTGSVPAIHGITNNDFIIQATGQPMYCTEDAAAVTVGSNTRAGKMSPRNMLVSTITDELRLATNFRSKVIGIALKDRGAILPAGHSANAAYWFDDVSGNWITSSYYMNDLPQWLKNFNDQRLPEKYLKKDWNTLYPINTYIQSSVDDNRYEGKFEGNSGSTFPVKTSTMFSKEFSVLRSTPYGNTLTVDLAKAAIENEQLGRDDITDFLTVSFSSTDYVGHKFGVNAIETEDTYLRLDLDLAAFFTYLDTKIGKGAYTVFLTADHGGSHNPGFLADHKIAGGHWLDRTVLSDLNNKLEALYHTKNIITVINDSEVHLNNKLIAGNGLDHEAIRKFIVEYLKKVPGVSFVVDNLSVHPNRLPELLERRLKNGYNARRSGPITFIPDPGWYASSNLDARGSSHGAWNPYDSHIPLLWMGWGIKHGQSNRPVNMTDIAPTVAALLHIQEPNGNIGKPVEEVILSR